MNNIVNKCPLAKSGGRQQLLHKAEEDAVKTVAGTNNNYSIRKTKWKEITDKCAIISWIMCIVHFASLCNTHTCLKKTGHTCYVSLLRIWNKLPDFLVVDPVCFKRLMKSFNVLFFHPLSTVFVISPVNSTHLSPVLVISSLSHLSTVLVICQQ